jgi:hypothetical protein
MEACSNCKSTHLTDIFDGDGRRCTNCGQVFASITKPVSEADYLDPNEPLIGLHILMWLLISITVVVPLLCIAYLGRNYLLPERHMVEDMMGAPFPQSAHEITIQLERSIFSSATVHFTMERAELSDFLERLRCKGLYERDETLECYSSDGNAEYQRFVFSVSDPSLITVHIELEEED